MQCQTTDRIHADFDFEDVAYVQGRLDGGGMFQIAHALSGFDFDLIITVHGRRGTVWCHLKDNRPVAWTTATALLRPGGLGRPQPPTGRGENPNLRPGGHRALVHPGLRGALRGMRCPGPGSCGSLRGCPSRPGAVASGPCGRRRGRGEAARRPAGADVRRGPRWRNRKDGVIRLWRNFQFGSEWSAWPARPSTTQLPRGCTGPCSRSSRGWRRWSWRSFTTWSSRSLRPGKRHRPSLPGRSTGCCA